MGGGSADKEEIVGAKKTNQLAARRVEAADCSSKSGPRLFSVVYFYCFLFRGSIWYLL